MKKFLVLLVALTLSCLLISCGNQGVNSSISTESHDVSSTQSSQMGESVDVPTSSNAVGDNIQDKPVGVLGNATSVQEKKYNYYEFLDLGIYYYYDKLPSGPAYHIITDYEELKRYVEKPFITKEELNSSYVIAVKTGTQEGYDIENTLYGIRELHFDQNGELSAVAEQGIYRRDDYVDVINPYPTDVVYILVSRTELDTEGKALQGSLNLTLFMDYDSYYHTYTGISENGLPLGQAWIIDSDNAKNSFEKAHPQIDLDPHVYRDKLLLVYYDTLGADIHFRNFRQENGEIFFDIRQKSEQIDENGCFYIVRVDKKSFVGNVEEQNVNVIKYEYEEAKIRIGGDLLTETLVSFVAGDYAELGLIKIPEFEWKLIDSQEALLEILTVYTNTSLENSIWNIDFESSYVLLHYAVEACTGCSASVDFENVRYSNGCLYVDKYYESHEGGDAESRSLYFIVIPKEKITGEITNVYVEENKIAAYSNGRYANSKYAAHIITEYKKFPDFEFLIIENETALAELYSEYSKSSPIFAIKNIDFEKMCIVAYVRMYDSSLVLGGFRNMRVENNKIFIYKYIEANGSLESNDAMYTVLHLVAVEKTFIPKEINEVVDICEIDWQ